MDHPATVRLGGMVMGHGLLGRLLVGAEHGLEVLAGGDLAELALLLDLVVEELAHIARDVRVGDVLRLAQAVLKGDLHDIKPIMQKSRELGMQTFDQALFDLYESDAITYDDAMRYADSMNELRLRIKLEGKAARNADNMAGLDHLALEESEEESGAIR